MTLAAHGMVEANPLDMIQYRHKIDTWNVKAIADMDSMHFKWFGEAKPTSEVARAAKLAGMDGGVVGRPRCKVKRLR